MSEETQNKIVAVIDAAEKELDPLAGLVERAIKDPGAAFEHDALLALAALKNENPAAFQRLRDRLKKAGCLVTALDEAIRNVDRNSGARHANDGLSAASRGLSTVSGAEGKLEGVEWGYFDIGSNL
jgi:hypothetical protein